MKTLIVITVLGLLFGLLGAVEDPIAPPPCDACEKPPAVSEIAEPPDYPVRPPEFPNFPPPAP